MIRLKQTTFILLTISILTSCDFINNIFKSKDITKELVESIIHKNYDKSLTYLPLKYDSSKNLNLDTVKMALAEFRKVIVKDFGTELDYSFMKSEKTFSTIDKENTIPNTTLVFIQISNKKEFGVLKVIFDDKSKKILSINLLNVKKPIPNMTIFWLFGLIAICIPIFNIFVIRLIKRSDLKKKWPKYLAVIFINVPTITYNAVNGLSYGLLSFQFLLGVSFNYMGYLNSAWAFGIPLGGLYWMWKLKFRKKKEIKTFVETEINMENIAENRIEN